MTSELSKEAELQEHCNRLFVVLIRLYDTVITPLDSRGSNVKCWKTRYGYDKSPLEDYFLAGIIKTVPSFTPGADPTEVVEITYKLPIKYWHMLGIMEYPYAPAASRATTQEVLERILRL